MENRFGLQQKWSQQAFNLKGMIIGNGVTDWKMDHEPGYLQMGIYYSLYGQDFAKQL